MSRDGEPGSAAEVLRRYDERRPDLVELATVVSLAVRVTPALLRRARIELTDATVAAESDLRYSSLVASHSIRGLVLDADVAAILRRRLQGTPLLERCYTLLQEVHEHALPTIRLEEELRYVALRGDEAEVERLLERALVTMAERPARGSGIARWADRAIPELPEVATETAAARHLTAASQKILGAPVEVGVRLTLRGIEVSEPPDEGAHVLELPPEPLRLEVRRVGTSDDRVVIEVKRGDVVSRTLDRRAQEPMTLELRTVDGQVARLRPLTAPEPEPAGSTGTLRRLVVCCDGMWNLPDTGGTAAPTNVAKIMLALARTDPAGVAQIMHYSSGAGTRRLSSLMGVDASHSVRECYRFLVENYEPGSELYFFGFSRGAFVARSVVGMILNCGILRPEHRGRVGEAYDLYRSRRAAASPQGAEAKIFRRANSFPETQIEFMGLWETVGKLGVPGGGLRSGFLARRWRLHDTALSRRVRHAYHALAIDERRASFEPTLWQQHDDAVDQTLEQVWFSGVHGDVGGGYRDSGLSDIALLWMAERARSCGLAFAPDRLLVGGDVAPDWRAPLHNSLTGGYRLLRARDRTLVADGGAVASSAARRWTEDPAYRPPGLDAYMPGSSRVVDVFDDAGPPTSTPA